jgi:hypothetical protein
MKRLNRPAPVRTEILACCQLGWGGPTASTGAAVPAYRLPALPQALSPRSGRPVALPQHEFGLDAIAQIGAWRYREHRSVPEMHALLRARHLPISERTV